MVDSVKIDDVVITKNGKELQEQFELFIDEHYRSIIGPINPWYTIDEKSCTYLLSHFRQHLRERYHKIFILNVRQICVMMKKLGYTSYKNGHYPFHRKYINLVSKEDYEAHNW
jgi:hypothetical protein